jgi:SAM-dependent methyltransferase
MNSLDALRERLDKVREIYDVDYLLALKTDPTLKHAEPKVSKTPHTLFHFNDRGKTGDDDTSLEASEFIEPYLEQNPVRQALELGAGMNGDALYLALRHPEIIFYRVTSFQSKLEYEATTYRGIKNYKTLYGSFDNLQNIHTGSMDISFSVESLSPFPKPKEAVTEVHRVLVGNGIFIVVDGYLGQSDMALSKDELISRHLVGRGTSINEFQTYDNFTDTVKTHGFVIESETDVTERTFSIFKKNEKRAAMMFDHPTAAKLASKVTDDGFALGMISDYLMPVAVELGMARYVVTVLRKQ